MGQYWPTKGDTKVTDFYHVYPGGAGCETIEQAVEVADRMARELDDSVKVQVMHGGILSYTTTGNNRELSKARREYEAEQKAKELVDGLGKFVNGMGREQADAFATALANEHPTLLGQIAKAVGIGVMRRATYSPWKPFDKYERICDGSPSVGAVHAEHDGRLDCTTVAGAELMARQSFI